MYGHDGTFKSFASREHEHCLRGGLVVCDGVLGNCYCPGGESDPEGIVQV